MKYLLATIALLSSFAGFSYSYFGTQQNFGADTTLPIAGTTYTLAGSGVSSSASSFTLTSLTLPQNGYKVQDADLSSTFYVTFEPGNRSRQEIASCTTVVQNANNTATLSGCTRGLSPITPYTASTSLQFAHAGGTSVIFSDPPQLFNQYIAKDNAATSSAVLVFSSTSPPRLDGVAAQAGGTYIATTSEFATFAALQSVVAAGAVNATNAVKGIIELATAAETAAGTSLGGTSASLVVPTSLFSATPSATTLVPVTSAAGKLAQGFFDLTQAFTFYGGATSTATTTIAASSTVGNPLKLNGVPYAFPAALTASSSKLTDDGTGKLIWSSNGVTVLNNSYLGLSTSNAATTTLTTITIPGNTLATNSMLRGTITWPLGAGTGSPICEIYLGNGASTSTIVYAPLSNGGSESTFVIFATSTSAQYITSKSYQASSYGVFAAPGATTNFATNTTFAVSSKMYLRIAGINASAGSASCVAGSFLLEQITQ